MKLSTLTEIIHCWWIPHYKRQVLCQQSVFVSNITRLHAERKPNVSMLRLMLLRPHARSHPPRLTSKMTFWQSTYGSHYSNFCTHGQLVRIRRKKED